MLTHTAQNYLASLRRIEPVPTSEVERVIRTQGDPCPEVWLEFHDRYAGYVEPIGEDTAIWGLVHRDSYWIEPGRASIEEIEKGLWYVTCAEVHPSYGYYLDNNGVFAGNQARSFDVKVERSALFSAFSAQGPVRMLVNELNEPDVILALRKDTAGQLETSASDEFSRYYRSTKYLVRENANTGNIVVGWMRV
jgi:hypothetical protein